MLFNTAFRRTLKAGDLTAAVARFSAVLAADEAAAVDACCAAAAAVGAADDVAEAAVFSADDVDAVAACAAWFKVLFNVGFVPSLRDLERPSFSPHNPPAVRPVRGILTHRLAKARKV